LSVLRISRPYATAMMLNLAPAARRIA